MNRNIRFVAFDEDRDDQAREEKAERRALRNAPVEDEDEDDNARFGGLNPSHPEFESVEAFAECLLDDEETVFDHRQLACLSVRTGQAVWLLRKALEGYGFALKARPVVRETRGFKANPHNRYEGNPMAGGGGGSSIYGMAS